MAWKDLNIIQKGKLVATIIWLPLPIYGIYQAITCSREFCIIASILAMPTILLSGLLNLLKISLSETMSKFLLIIFIIISQILWLFVFRAIGAKIASDFNGKTQ